MLIDIPKLYKNIQGTIHGGGADHSSRHRYRLKPELELESKASSDQPSKIGL